MNVQQANKQKALCIIDRLTTEIRQFDNTRRTSKAVGIYDIHSHGRVKVFHIQDLSGLSSLAQTLKKHFNRLPHDRNKVIHRFLGEERVHGTAAKTM